MAERANPFQAPAWDSNDSAALRDFLGSRAGVRMVHRLRTDRPPILPAPGRGIVSDIGVAVTAAAAEGYETCITNIFEYLSTMPSEVATSMYPDLDDNSAWPAELQTPAATP